MQTLRNRQRQSLLIVLLLMMAVCSAVWGQETRPQVELANLERQALRGTLAYWPAGVDTTLSKARDATFEPVTLGDVNQGITSDAYWLHLRLNNRDADVRHWVLVHETSYLDNIEVHWRHSGDSAFEHRHLSDRVPFGQRPVDYRKLAFEQKTSPGGYTDLYLKVYNDKPDSVSLQFTLYDRLAFERMVREENLLFGGYYGILAVLILLAIIVGTLLRRVSVLSYGLLLLVTGVQWLLLNGYGFQYLWPQSVYWHNEGFHISYLLFSLLACTFSKTFLRTQDRFPRTHWVLSALQLVALLGIGLRLMGWYVPVLHLSFALLAVMAIVLPLISWRAWRAGVRYARWYVFAWSIYSVSLLLSLASAYLNVVPGGMHSLVILQWGSLVEAILLTVAITERLLSVETERRKAVELANRDPLTGLGNRRMLQREYERFKHQFQRDRRPVFLIMIDLDHFKVVNDRYGHDAGDQVLREVADLLRAHSRVNDVSIRYGGEEFALLLQADDISAAWQVAERIRKEFAERPTAYLQEQIPHTLSSGITPVLEGERLLSVNEMMKYADQALYQGKAAGRNCNVIYREGDNVPQDKADATPA